MRLWRDNVQIIQANTPTHLDSFRLFVQLLTVHVEICKLFFTDRVRSTREGYVLTRVCPSVILHSVCPHLGGGGGYPSQAQLEGGYSSQVQAGGYPSQVWGGGGGGVSQPGPDRGVWGYPTSGIPPSDLARGYPDGGTPPWVLHPVTPGCGGTPMGGGTPQSST